MHAGTSLKLMKNACLSIILVVVVTRIISEAWSNVKSNVLGKLVRLNSRDARTAIFSILMMSLCYLAKDLCEIPAETGECQNYVPKWYYDTKDMACRQFYYGGCGGNGNKFDTQEACLQRCEKKPEEEPEPEVGPELEPEAGPEPEATFSSRNCFLPVQPGSCRNYSPRWYYNSTTGTCDQFMYTGCEGNENNFVTEAECEDSCFHVQHTCTLPPLPGRCHENMTKWYYDTTTRRCQEFAFSGCSGNRNNFYNESECNAFCGQAETPEIQIAVRYSIFIGKKVWI